MIGARGETTRGLAGGAEVSLARQLTSSIVIGTYLCACASTQSNPGVSEAQRASLGAVGVVQIALMPKGDVAVGPRGKAAGAAHGAGAGALAGAGGALSGLNGWCSDALGCVAALVIVVPIFAAGGAVYGAVHGAAVAVPEDKASDIERELSSALSGAQVSVNLQSEVLKSALQSGVPNIRGIDPIAAMAAGAPVDYRTLSGSGVKTVLEVGFAHVALQGGGGDDPELVLVAQAVVRLVDVRTNAELYRSDAFQYASQRHRFSEWSADQARPLREELERATGALAASIVDEVFLTVRSN